MNGKIGDFEFESSGDTVIIKGNGMKDVVLRTGERISIKIDGRIEKLTWTGKKFE